MSDELRERKERQAMVDRGNQLVKTIFNTDNFFMRGCEKILDLVTVNLLFILSCVPIVTIGIAKISLYQTLFELKRTRRINAFTSYVMAFKQNVKIGFQLGAIELLILGICLVDLFLFWGQAGLFFQILKVVCLALILFSTVMFLCVYPLAGKFEMTVRDLLQTGLIIVSLNFLWFFLMLALLIAIIIFLYTSGFIFLLGATVFILLGFSSLASLQLGIVEKLFDKYA